MEIEKIDRMISTIGLFGKISFGLLLSLIHVTIIVVLLFGSVASVILLYKLFPVISITMLSAGIGVYHFVNILFNIIIFMLAIFVTVFSIFYVAKFMEESKIRVQKKRDREKEIFMDEMIKKIKKESKK